MENERKVDRVWFDPVCLLHKRISTRFLSLSPFFLFLALLRRLVLWETLTLNSSFQPRISQNMVQSLLFIVLNMNLALKFTNPSWGNVNLGFACGFRTVLVLAFLLIQIFSWMLLYIDSLVYNDWCTLWTSESLTVFWKFLGFLQFRTKTLWIRTGLHCSEIHGCFWTYKDEVFVFTWVSIGGLS